jgi:hypothetical protein
VAIWLVIVVDGIVVSCLLKGIKNFSGLFPCPPQLYAGYARDSPVSWLCARLPSLVTPAARHLWLGYMYYPLHRDIFQEKKYFFWIINQAWV